MSRNNNPDHEELLGWMGWRFAWFELRYQEPHVSGYTLNYDRFAADNLARQKRTPGNPQLHAMFFWFLFGRFPWKVPSHPLYWHWKNEDLARTEQFQGRPEDYYELWGTEEHRPPKQVDLRQRAHRLLEQVHSK